MKKTILFTVLAIIFVLTSIKTAFLVADGRIPAADLAIPFLFTGLCSFFAWRSFRASRK